LAPMPLRADDPTRIGHYRLTARLGVGGMGVVYLGVGWDGSQVAVKLMRPELADDEEFRRRFGREVAALVQVKGKCTVRVIEADSQSPRPFVVTEYAEGPSLAEHIGTHGRVGPDMLHDLATGLAEALTVIHAAGIMHRDLKPSNIILTDAGPKVIDFGIARRQDTTAMTRTGMMIGSLGFMAPEQISGHPGPAADIFAWGLTVGYAAAGQPPFGTGNAHAILYRVMYGDPDIAAVPELLRPMVAAALAKDPQDRPSARQLLDRLTALSPRSERTSEAATHVISSPTWQTGLHAGSPAAQRANDAEGPLAVDTAPAGLAPSEPVLAGHVPSEPAPSEPASSEPAPSEPASSEPASSEPAPSEPPSPPRTSKIHLSRRWVTIAVPAIVVIAAVVVIVALTTHLL
jgi:serine/threonine protein kinase